MTVMQQFEVFDGYCVTRGVEPLDLRPDRLMNLMYHWLLQNSESRSELDALLTEPLPWEAKNRTTAQMSSDDMGDWSSMIGSGPT